MHNYHFSLLMGHSREEKVVKITGNNYYWPAYHEDTANFAKAFDICESRKIAIGL